MISETKLRLYQCIASFLKDECTSSDYSCDTIESLEGNLMPSCLLWPYAVARQCIESAFEVSGNSEPYIDLLTLFEKSMSVSRNLLPYLICRPQSQVLVGWPQRTRPRLRIWRHRATLLWLWTSLMRPLIATARQSPWIPTMRFITATGSVSNITLLWLVVSYSFIPFLIFRAAAKSRLNKDNDCIEDCEKALKIDPAYSKAYGRMGLVALLLLVIS